MTECREGDPTDILLVEDNPGDIRLTQEAFKESRLTNELHAVEDGIAALDFLFQRNTYADAPRPDLIPHMVTSCRWQTYHVLNPVSLESCRQIQRHDDD